ncbi:MAG: CPBP family intramembrane metalloprotease [Sandaracinaceae bacterium]|nr:CPBP family intramembrane metalloprotease [Sandaracinaceae bacterium]
MRRLRYPFWNDVEGRPRALVRIGLQLAVFGVLSLLVQLAFWRVQRVTGDAWTIHTAFFLAASVAVVASVWAGCRFLDRRALSDLGLRLDGRWALDAAFGVALGLVLIFAVSAVERAMGWASYAPRAAPSAPHALAGVAVFVGVAVLEELLFRGYQLVNLAEGLRAPRVGPAAAVVGATVISSVVFGLAHTENPHAGAIATTNVAFAGVMLAAGFVLTGELGVSIGLHLSWNWCQNALDMPVSGRRDFGYAALVERVEDGPDWITGGAFGPEAGATGLVAMIVGTLAIAGYARALEGRARVHDALRVDAPRVL